MDIGCQILCPFMLDQFYWAERMFWLGVAPEPLKRNHLVPDNVDDTSIKEAAEALSQAIQYALSPRVKECAKEIAERISVEDGVSEAVKNLKEEMGLF
ncbi:SWIM-type domain-containing protein [Citrus sinensis]|uniref:SWIM-type domain-containing protein n=1 Tax=Citrus sinensis TaxID=2711 RepID=A0ACB8KBX9_CITSI|nr:SWIM-type domain-containing protein [Citrus sinensis]